MLRVARRRGGAASDRAVLRDSAEYASSTGIRANERCDKTALRSLLRERKLCGLFL